MKQVEITARITVSLFEELCAEEKSLIESAKSAAMNAYAPYSQFKVGAAVLLENNEVVIGNNQENMAYPSGLCAERVAVCYANAIYPNVKVKTIAVAAFFNGDYVEQISPCGSCRQVLQEVENKQKHPVRILLYGRNEIYIIKSIQDLMPLNFSF